MHNPLHLNRDINTLAAIVEEFEGETEVDCLHCFKGETDNGEPCEKCANRGKVSLSDGLWQAADELRRKIWNNDDADLESRDTAKAVSKYVAGIGTDVSGDSDSAQ